MQTNNQTPKRKKSNTLFILIVVVLVLIYAYYQYYLYLKDQEAKRAEEQVKENTKQNEEVKKINEEVKKDPTAKKRTYYTIEQIANCVQGFKPLSSGWTLKSIGEGVAERIRLCLNTDIVGIEYNYKGKIYYSKLDVFWRDAKSAGVDDAFIIYYVPNNLLTGAKGMLGGEYKEFAYSALEKMKKAGYTNIKPFSGEY